MRLLFVCFQCFNKLWVALRGDGLAEASKVSFLAVKKNGSYKQKLQDKTVKSLQLILLLLLLLFNLYMKLVGGTQHVR